MDQTFKPRCLLTLGFRNSSNQYHRQILLVMSNRRHLNQKLTRWRKALLMLIWLLCPSLQFSHK